MHIGPEQWAHESALSVVSPHSWDKILSQSAIAILLLVGFESATAMSNDAKNPREDIPRAVLLSLLIQGICCYFMGYFATGYVVNDLLTAAGPDATELRGFEALAWVAAPMGDIIVQATDALLSGGGLVMWCLFAVTAIMALVGTALSAINTSARIAAAISLDGELPAVLGCLHPSFQTPWVAVVVLGFVCSAVGSIGCLSVEALTGMAKASNLGTFVLYAMICLTSLISFSARGQNPCLQCDHSCVFHALVPILGLAFNILLVVVIFKDAFAANRAAIEDIIAISVASGWFFIHALYFVISSLVLKKDFLWKAKEETRD